MTDALHFSTSDQNKMHLGKRPERPMLARVADAIYWMSRYIERAEHISRALLVQTDLLTDVGDMAPQLRHRMWTSVMQLTDGDQVELPEEAGGEGVGASESADPELAVTTHMTMNTLNPNSLVNCLTKARENARCVREVISSDMWETLNTQYWSIRSEETAARFSEAPSGVYQAVIDGSLLIQGLTAEALPHGQPWLFTQLAKYLERIDMTCRILESKYQLLTALESQLETPLRNIHWMALLRTCCSIEGYRRVYLGDMEPLRIATFVIFEPDFPRAIRFCVQNAQACAARIGQLTNPSAPDGADRILGRLNAELEFGDARAILRRGLPSYLQSIREQTALAAQATQKAYFLAS